METGKTVLIDLAVFKQNVISPKSGLHGKGLTPFKMV
jgi:hypothetical protein